MDYIDFKEEMKKLRDLQEEQNRTCAVDGRRYLLPLNGKEIEVVVYKTDLYAPVLFCAYGGGFALGACALDNDLWNVLHKELNATVVSIGYRKAPQYPFPAALYDVYDAIEYIESHQDEFGICSRDYSVYGNSAGGNLATAVCMLDISRGSRLNIKRQILNYPYCDLATVPEEKGHPEAEWFMYRMFVEYYCREENVRNPMVSPVFADRKSLEKMPYTIISLAEADPLLAEGARYMCKLRAAGVKVESHIASNMGHGYSETYFQGENENLSFEMRQQMRDGSMKREVYNTIRFIKEHYN